MHHCLLPGLVDAQVGGVDESTQDQIGEILTEVLKVHPRVKRSGVRRQWRGAGEAVRKERDPELTYQEPRYKPHGQKHGTHREVLTHHASPGVVKNIPEIHCDSGER